MTEHAIPVIDLSAGTDSGEKHPPVTYTEHYLGKVMKASHRRTDAGVADAVAEG